MGSELTYTINLTKDAFERLCAIRDLLEGVTGQWLALNLVCSSLICQIQVEGLD